MKFIDLPIHGGVSIWVDRDAVVAVVPRKFNESCEIHTTSQAEYVIALPIEDVVERIERGREVKP